MSSTFLTAISQLGDPIYFHFGDQTLTPSADSEHLIAADGTQYTIRELVKTFNPSAAWSHERHIPTNKLDSAAFAKFAPAVRRRIEALRLALYYSPKEIVKIDEQARDIFDHFLNSDIDGVISRNWRAYLAAFVNPSSGGRDYQAALAAQAFMELGPLSDYSFLPFTENSLYVLKPVKDIVKIKSLRLNHSILSEIWSLAASEAARRFLLSQGTLPPAKNFLYARNIFFSRLYSSSRGSLSLTGELRQACFGAFQEVIEIIQRKGSLPEDFLFYLRFPKNTVYLPQESYKIGLVDWLKYPYHLSDIALEQRQKNCDEANWEIFLKIYPLLPTEPFPTSVLLEHCRGGSRQYKKFEAMGYIAQVPDLKKGNQKYWTVLCHPSKETFPRVPRKSKGEKSAF